jgi:signal transduction histidine kinase
MGEVELLQQENQRLSQELKQRLFELSVLYDISNSISYSLDYDIILRFIMDSLHKVVDYDLCLSLIVLEQENKAKMAIRASHKVNRQVVEEVKRKAIEALSNFRGASFTESEIVIDLKGEISEDNQLPGRIKSSFDVPLFVRDRAVGILNVASTKNISYSDDEIKLFYTIASQAQAAIERLQAILAAEKSKMQAMVEGMSEGVVMFDELDHLVIFNNAGKIILGYPGVTVSTGSLLEYLCSLGLFQSLEDIKQEEKFPRVKELYLEKPYPHIAHSEAIYMRDSEGKPLGMVILLRDVTREREIDQMKNEFVSLVSHELRTPLTAIKGAMDNILDGIVGEITPLQKDCMEIIKRNIDRLGRLIADLLDISRIEAGKIQLSKQPVDLAFIIGETLQLFQETTKANGLILKSSVAPDLPRVEADADKITQVITNLVGNAVKFTPAGGRINVGASREEGFVRVDVVDTGSGIPPQEVGKIFDKFYQVARLDGQQKKGTGLGLTICKGIIEKHGGKIWAESEMGKGSKFSFILPA